MSAARDAKRNGTRIVEAELDKIGRAVGLELVGGLVRVTPKDTGRAAGNWNISEGAEDASTSDARRPPDALKEGAVAIQAFRLSKEDLYATNGLPYIGPLNDGSSTQAPAGFVQLEARRVGRTIEGMADG